LFYTGQGPIYHQVYRESRYKRDEIMAHAAPQPSHRGAKWAALAVMVVVLLGFIGGIILRATPVAPTHHLSVTHSAPVRPSHDATPAPKTEPTPIHKHTPNKPAEKRTAPQPVTTYTVRTGDSLWTIAAHVYHNPLGWHKLYQLNQQKIGGNPNLIHAGIVLQLE
jgi:nucleoid-associated protein YgaU